MSVKRKVTDLSINKDLFSILVDSNEEESVGAIKWYLEDLGAVERAEVYTKGGYDLSLQLSEELDKEEAFRKVELLKDVNDMLYKSTKSFLDIHIQCKDLLGSVDKMLEDGDNLSL